MSKRKIPETSREASDSLDPVKIRDIYQRILWALSQIGEGTWEDISLILKERDSKIWRRLSEMQRLDMIYRTQNKKLLSSGCKGYTWKATFKSTPTVQDHSRNIQSISKSANQLKLL